MWRRLKKRFKIFVVLSFDKNRHYRTISEDKHEKLFLIKLIT